MPMRTLSRWSLRILIALAGLVLLLAAALWATLRASLPTLDGELHTAAVHASVGIERDALGTAIIRGATRADVAYGLGYVHGQERYFEIDLLRRRAAGRLAELFGPAALEIDRKARVHRFEARAESYFATLPDAHREWIERYVAGVNEGRRALGARPFPYLLLRQQPEDFQARDTLLAPLAMYFDLQDEDNARELKLERMHAALPPGVYAFLTAPGTEWDAPLDGGAYADPPIPGADSLDLRGSEVRDPPADAPPGSEGIGSNNFAVAGSITPHGGAILANDMHLGLRVPNIWFRTQLRYPDPDVAGAERVVTGVSLPGTPFIVVGSNGDVAWGYTNSYGDWLDFVELQPDPADPSRYLSAGGPEPIETYTETLRVRGGEAQTLAVRQTRFGPIVAESSAGLPLALQWTAHHAQAVNTVLVEMEMARTLEQAVDVAQRAGVPAQNALIASRDGRIAWTLMGQIPRRARTPAILPWDSRDPGAAWQGWLSQSEHPLRIDPPQARLWTANARVVDGEDQAKIGDGGYTIGARARQIRDGLLRRERIGESDLLAIQLDHEAVFMQRWWTLLQSVSEASQHPELKRLQQASRQWDGAASVDSVSYTLARAFRLRVHKRFLGLFEAPLKARDPDWTWPALPQLEGAVWQTIQTQPAHLLPRNHASWAAWLEAAALDVATRWPAEAIAAGKANWGEVNRSSIRHPLSRALPAFAWLLDMPAQPLPGDQYMPHVQGPSFGASERMVVSPGREAEGIFHMPGGQSGHPLSPFYGAGHADWAEGRASAFLPGPALHRLQIMPAPVEAARIDH